MGASTVRLELVPPHPYDACEKKLSRFEWCLYVPVCLGLIVPLVLVRLFLVLTACVASYAVCSVCGGNRRIMLLTHRLIGRVLLIGFGVWPGCLSVRGELSSSAPVAVIAPHVSALDGLFWIGYRLPKPVALEPYANLPIVGTLFRATGGVAVPLRSANAIAKEARDGHAGKRQTAVAPIPAVPPMDAPSGGDESGGGKGGGGGTSAVRAAIQKHKLEFDASSGAPPMVLLPEGTTANGLSLLKFFSGAFEGGGPIQPVIIKYPYRHFNDAAFLTTLPSHLLRLLSAPYIRMEVTFLDVYTPNAEEAADPQLFADNVRLAMSEASGLPLSQYSAKELRKEMKEQAQGRTGTSS